MIHEAGMHHFHSRDDALQSSNKAKRIVDKLVYIGAFYGPIVTLPQVWKIWSEQSTQGVSVFSWAAYLVMAVIWMWYGMVHKEKPIILTQILWIIIEVAIVVGAIMYG